MKTMSAKEAKNAFGQLMDTARAEPVTIEKHGRPVIVVMAVEEYERLAAGGDRLGKKSRSSAGFVNKAAKPLHR